MANRRLVIDDGTKELIVENQYGQEICKLHVRTGDYSILDRYNQMLKDLPEVVKPLENVSIKNDGTNDFEDEWKVIKDVEAALIKRLSEFFDTDEIKLIFEKRNAFSSVGGKFFVEVVLVALGEELARAISEETKKSAKRMSKYLSDLSDLDGESDAGKTA